MYLNGILVGDGNWLTFDFPMMASSVEITFTSES